MTTNSLATVSSRIAYKIDSVCHTLLTIAYPKYLLELLTVYTPARPLRSFSDENILNVATTRSSHMVSEHLHTRDPAIGTESLVKVEGSRHDYLWEKAEDIPLPSTGLR